MLFNEAPWPFASTLLSTLVLAGCRSSRPVSTAAPHAPGVIPGLKV
jgi:hypothetical protein